MKPTALVIAVNSSRLVGQRSSKHVRPFALHVLAQFAPDSPKFHLNFGTFWHGQNFLLVPASDKDMGQRVVSGKCGSQVQFPSLCT